jgi:LPXTG-motif cell wall-anchored protein
MSRTILSRLGAGVIATALVAGGSFLAASPALAAGDAVNPNTVVENTWGTNGGLTITGTVAAEGDGVQVDIVNGNTDAAVSYLKATTDKETVAGVGGAYSKTFSWTPDANDFDFTPSLGETVFARIIDTTGTAAAVFVPIEVTAFAPAAAATTIVPSCIGADAAASVGVTATGTGFGQFEEGILVSITDANGVNFGTNENFDADETGSVTVTSKLFTNLGLIADGNYTIAFSSVVTGLVTSNTFKVGACDSAPAVVTPPAPAAVAPAAPQLANTGSSDAGVLVGGSALLLLVGAALVVARRRQNAAA